MAWVVVCVCCGEDGLLCFLFSSSPPRRLERVWAHRVPTCVARYIEVYEVMLRYMEAYGGIWRHMEVYGGIWRYMEVYVEVYGGIWRYMEYVEVYGGIWRNMEAQ
jgi:hypothetical protein